MSLAVSPSFRDVATYRLRVLLLAARPRTSLLFVLRLQFVG